MKLSKNNSLEEITQKTDDLEFDNLFYLLKKKKYMPTLHEIKKSCDYLLSEEDVDKIYSYLDYSKYSLNRKDLEKERIIKTVHLIYLLIHSYDTEKFLKILEENSEKLTKMKLTRLITISTEFKKNYISKGNVLYSYNLSELLNDKKKEIPKKYSISIEN